MRNSTELGQYDFPTRIVYGAGARRQLAGVLREAGVERPLLVTDRGLATLPVLSMVEEALQGIDFLVFSGVDGNPVKSQVEAGGRTYATHAADGLVAVGGGASIDVAKAIAIAVSQNGDLFDYALRADGQRKLTGELPFIAALPTTAGTGSEVGRSTVICDDDTHVKHIIRSPKLLPAFVAADPELLICLPPAITAATGMDALTHLVESYLAKAFHPLCDGVALHGIRILSRWLRPAYEFSARPDDSSNEHLTARGMMLNASMMGALAFQKGLGLTHSCTHALSTVCDLHHGLANGIMIDYCMAFNRPAAEEAFCDMARAAGVEAASPESFLRWLTDLKNDLDIPAGLEQTGVREEDIPELVRFALLDRCHPLGPREVSREDFRQIFSAALV